MSIQAMKMALEALGYGYDAARCFVAVEAIRNAEAALRAAIEAAERQEPVASVNADDLTFLKRNDDWIRARLPNKESLNLFATPQPVIPALLYEAHDYGQFDDDFDQPLAKPIRKAIRDMLAAAPKEMK